MQGVIAGAKIVDFRLLAVMSGALSNSLREEKLAVGTVCKANYCFSTTREEAGEMDADGGGEEEISNSTT